MTYEIWWRTRQEPVSAQEETLLAALYRAHQASAIRANSSSVVVANAARASGDLSKALIAGLATLGGRHAPLKETFALLADPEPAALVNTILLAGRKVPGWGGTFQKNAPDPLWQEVHECLTSASPALAAKFARVSAELKRLRGLTLYPNPSAYTAGAGWFLGVPSQALVYLFLAPRLAPWTQFAYVAILGPED